MVGLSGADSNNYRTILAAKATSLPYSNSVNETDTEDKLNDPRTYNIIDSIKQQQKHLSETKVVEMIEKYKTGIATTVLAEEYGCHKTTIRAILRRNGIVIAKQPAANKIDTARAIAMYEEMHTIAEIARHFGVCDSAIRKRLIDNNIPLRSRWSYLSSE